MKGINKVMLIGVVGQDPEVRDANEVKVASFSLATSESYKPKDSDEWKEITEWHNIVAWGGLANYIEKAVAKGTAIYVEGKLKTRSYDDKEGVKRYRTEIISDQISILRKKDSGTVGMTNASADVANSSSEDDDLPF
jgi:single-strand DNA-binding protein